MKIGVVNFRCRKREPAVLEVTPGVDANSLFVLVSTCFRRSRSL